MSVPVPPSPERLIRFDTFEVDVRTGELRKDGVKVKLAEQPFSVLALLIAQPGEVVTRDELQQKLWPRDTFVDFDRGLNKAINRLRDALGDSADAPRFIETLPKRGYRFVGSTLPSSAATPDSAEPPPAARRPWLAWSGALAAAVLAILAAWWWTADRAVPPGAEPLIQSSLLPPKDRAFVPYSLALSRDGAHLAFVAEAADGSRSLWIRAMATTTAIAIAGTDGASFPFWSPDARHIAFFADRKLKVVEVAGGAIRIVADARRASGGAWNSDDVIVFAPDVNGPLYRVSASGGTPTPVSRVPEGDDFYGHRWPVFLPDNNHFLYVALSAAARSDNSPELHIGSLDSIESTRIEWDGARSVTYTLDHLLYVRSGALYAQPFSSAERRTTGRPVPVASVDLAATPAFFPAPLAVSTNGVVVFQSSTDLPSQLVWLDEHGREQSALAGIKYSAPALSPDGRRLAGSCEGPRDGTTAICVRDLERGVASRITEGPRDRYPVWSRDGQEIAYSSVDGIYRTQADGSASPQIVSRRGIPTSWSPDGQILSFGSRHGEVSLALSSPKTQEVTELGIGVEGQLSRDGAWLAYVAQDGLVVQRFPASGARVTVAGAGAAQPRWSADGRQLFYVSADKKLMAADFDPVAATASAPRLLTQTRIVGAAFVGHQYDVAPDGRFIVSVTANDAAPLTLMSGWTSKLHTAQAD
jgi:DNA-binding winged helix-turn-helix (wHTH) protein/Tol biopolymer transport system component